LKLTTAGKGKKRGKEGKKKKKRGKEGGRGALHFYVSRTKSIWEREGEGGKKNGGKEKGGHYIV